MRVKAVFRAISPNPSHLFPNSLAVQVSDWFIAHCKLPRFLAVSPKVSQFAPYLSHFDPDSSQFAPYLSHLGVIMHWKSASYDTLKRRKHLKPLKSTTNTKYIKVFASLKANWIWNSISLCWWAKINPQGTRQGFVNLSHNLAYALTIHAVKCGLALDWTTC